MSKRRTWLKVPLAVDAAEQDVIGLEVTTLEGSDAERFGGRVGQVDATIDRIAADGAYDTREAYEVAAQRGGTLVVRPRENAVPGKGIIRVPVRWLRSRRRGADSASRRSVITVAAWRKPLSIVSNNSLASGWLHAGSSLR